MLLRLRKTVYHVPRVHFPGTHWTVSVAQIASMVKTRVESGVPMWWDEFSGFCKNRHNWNSTNFLQSVWNMVASKMTRTRMLSPHHVINLLLALLQDNWCYLWCDSKYFLMHSPTCITCDMLPLCCQRICYGVYFASPNQKVSNCSHPGDKTDMENMQAGVEELQNQATLCNQKKMNSRMAQEASVDLFFNVLVNVSWMSTLRVTGQCTRDDWFAVGWYGPRFFEPGPPIARKI